MVLGSFTGVRIGIATAKAFCDVKNIPVVAINSLENLAFQVGKTGIVCSMIDAGHGNSYTGLFEIQEVDSTFKISNSIYGFLNLQDENGKNSSNELSKFITSFVSNTSNKNIYFVGNATEIYGEIIKSLQFDNINICTFLNFNAITIGTLGYIYFKDGKYGDTSILSPMYLRKSQAEIMLEEKNKSNL